MQIEGMREHVGKCAVAREKGNMADQMRVKEALPPLLSKYLKDQEADEKEGYPPMSSKNGSKPHWTLQKTSWSMWAGWV